MPPLSDTDSTQDIPDSGPPSAAVAPAVTEAPASQDTAVSSAPDVQDSAEPTSLLDAVLRSVVKDKGSEAPADGAQPAGDDRTPAEGQAAPAAQGEPAAGAAADEADITEADLDDIQKPGIRKRISKLIAQRNEVREQLATIAPDANAWRQHREFLASNHVSPQDSQMLYGVASALARGDYKTFLEAVSPYVEAAQTALGIRLPADIQRQVDDGLLPEDTARELVRTRAEAETARAQALRATQTVTATQQQQHTAHLRGAVADWEATVRKNDPDFAHKQDALQRHAQALVATRGLPRTREEAVAMAQEAYDEVTRLAARFRPAPAPTRLSPASVHVPNQGTAEPRNLLDAVQMGLRRARASA